MKAALQLDPITDVVANRVPNAFLRHRARAGTSGPVGQIRRLAAGLDAWGLSSSSPRAVTGRRGAGGEPSSGCGGGVMRI